MRLNTARAASREWAWMANCWGDMEVSAAVPANLPHRGDSLLMRKKEFTWATPETAGSWRCKWNETIDAHHRVFIGIDVDPLFAGRNVSILADAILHAGRVCAGELRAGRDCASRSPARRWESMSND